MFVLGMISILHFWRVFFHFLGYAISMQYPFECHIRFVERTLFRIVYGKEYAFILTWIIFRNVGIFGKQYWKHHSIYWVWKELRIILIRNRGFQSRKIHYIILCNELHLKFAILRQNDFFNESVILDRNWMYIYIGTYMYVRVE